MAFTAHPTVVSGQTWTAANQNTYVKGNLDTLFPYTGASQIICSTLTSAISLLSPSTSLQFLRGITSVSLEFGSLIYKRQGRSSANWFSNSSAGSYTDYTPNAVIFQAGEIVMTSTAGVTLTFPKTYSKVPIIFMTPYSSFDGLHCTAIPSTIGATIYPNNTTTFGVWTAMWLAIGE